MDKIEERLHDSSKKCFDCYEAWSKDNKDIKAREDLREAIHELRKVASRLEIDLAVSERGEITQKPLAVPSHRDSQRRDPSGDNVGNSLEGSTGARPSQHKKRPPRRGKLHTKKVS